VNDQAIIYLNRLSDLLFVLARWANRQAGVREDPWTAPAENGGADSSADTADTAPSSQEADRA
jgi:cob(I)alamin adenosyltransferase